MPDPLHDPRITTLLRHADGAKEMIESLTKRGTSSQEVVETLDGIYKDLGRMLHELYRQQPTEDKPAVAGKPIVGKLADPDVDPVTMEVDWSQMVHADSKRASSDSAPVRTDLPDYDDDSDEEGGDRWYTEEVDLEGPPKPFFDPNDPLPAEEEPPKPTPPPLPPIHTPTPRMPRVFTPPVDDEVLPSEPSPMEGEGEITDTSLQRIVTVDGAMMVSADGTTVPVSLEDRSAWLGLLRDLLDLMGPPLEGAEPTSMAEEAGRVQWATSRMEAQWEPFPIPVKVSLLGLVGARCRHLLQHLIVDTGPRQALERLRRYRKRLGLAPVVSLVPDRAPEYASWSEDAKHWWDALTTALK
jgi:hypothetical protein